MVLKDEITTKVKSILDEKFDVVDVTTVPDIADSRLTFGNMGLQFEATVLYIDMRGSTEVLNNHNKPVVAKIHMVYFHTIVKIAKSLGGEVRSFNGDSMLVFFPGTTKSSLNNAVTAARQMYYMIDINEGGINKLLEKYTPIDFGIGLDDGKILCTKIGVGGDSNNKDLIWIGNAVNKATVLSDLSRDPNHVAISSYVYNNLLDGAKYAKSKDLLGNETKIDMWRSKTFTYNNQQETYYYTSWYRTVN